MMISLIGKWRIAEAPWPTTIVLGLVGMLYWNVKSIRSC